MRPSWILLAVLALAACAGGPAPIGPSTSPEALVPAQWPAARSKAPAEPAAIPVDATWWRGFNDPRLNRLIEIAHESNRDLRSTALRLDFALAQARIAGAQLEPQAGLSVDTSRRRQNFIGLPIPGTEDGVLSNTSTSLGASLNVSWEADLWGRLRAGRNAAENRAAAAAFDLADAGLSISGQTAKAWFAFLEAQSQIELAGETEDNRSRVRQRIERRYRSGLRTALDLRLAVASEATATAALAARQRQLDLTRRQLEVLIAREPEALGILDKVVAEQARLPELPAAAAPDLPVETLRRRPDVRASELRLSAAGLDVKAARRLLYPQLTLTASSGRSSNQIEDLLDRDFSIWSLASGLLQPLFQGGRLRAGVDLAEANRLDLLSRHESAVIRALTDVESQLAVDGFLADQYAAVETAAEASTAARELAQERYFAGLSDYLDVLSAEDSATAASSQLLDIERRRLEQRVDLYLALGGGLPVPQLDPADTETQAADIEDQT